MKFAIPSLLALLAVSCPYTATTLSASESAPDSGSAVETLRAGIEVHPDQAVMLFQDSLQTNPDSRRALFVAALETMGDDVDLVIRLVAVARLEFPDDEVEFAELALASLPEQTEAIREAFALDPGSVLAKEAGDTGGPATMETTAADPLDETPPDLPEAGPLDTSLAADPRVLDEQIREAMARVAAKTAGLPWPEQPVPDLQVQFKKPDEVRIPRKSRGADETSLFQHLPLDRTDEREVAPGQVRLDDAWRPSDGLRLDESKFAPQDRGAERLPEEAAAKSLAPAGAVGLPRRPMLRSSVYRIPPAAGSYESTIDQESGEGATPSLVIRPEPASPSQPR